MSETGKRGKRSRKVRLEDIAERCGVSLSTASRALAGEKGVRPELRARVMDIARALNYAVPASATGRKVVLAASSAAMVDYVRNQFTLHVLDGLNARARALGVEIVTQPVADPAQDINVLEAALSEEEVAGFLFLTLDDEEVLSLSRSFGKPVVLVNGDDPLMRLSSVTPCNRSAARLGAEHLLQLGHRRILFLMRRGRRTIERRFEGWRDALAAHGITDVEDLVVEVEDWLPDLAAEAIGARIARRGLDFTAVLAAGDSLAVGAMLGLARSGHQVPGDVSVVGMDDLPQAAFHNPPLTTIHIPMREIGSAALDLLLDGVDGLAVPPRRIELACQIIERQSTAANTRDAR
ncbi:LacI family DNA-binding transcriptional regulator [Nitratireductor sp. ZSWI3]|uniref:LacI family DNA-binding transcriptional regulator n=1 Tax=Nitratireductor sp. ZSWI3 TaxID=2966359 RepID=UPI00214F677D|nr:LacI family DNA-binding transcriptional regulator [Nitratireductor sp. ZSWI3]MCR4268094.1 LacI family transcriptional regulator [Nitratireductor sp. ZSWI3]